jgi:Asp-tRNA(Asn)/Glu-tRNA(Gln) amidotransferase A subunit family amidase
LPGGSSTGTATAVAASLGVLGLAEETGGSIQNPASTQRLVGIKPTVALVPNVGVLPLSSPREVVGPIGRCVRDAAPALDALTGFTMADPKTVAGIGRKPPGGYVADLKPDALRGKRIGTHGPGRRNLPLSEEATALYRRALGEIEAQGAILVEDPFAGSGFADLRAPTVPGEEYDARGLESLPYDLGKYLERLGPDAAIKTFAEFAAATKAEDPFAPAGVLSYVPRLAAFNSSLADPTRSGNSTSLSSTRSSPAIGWMRRSPRKCASSLRRVRPRTSSTKRRSARLISPAFQASQCPRAPTPQARRSI